MHIFISSDVLNEIEIISNINCPLSKRFFAKSVESIRYTSIRWTDYPVLISCKTETFDNFIRILKSILLYCIYIARIDAKLSQLWIMIGRFFLFLLITIIPRVKRNLDIQRARSARRKKRQWSYVSFIAVTRNLLQW